MNNFFKFTIRLPRRNPGFGEYQRATIITEAPYLYMRWNLSSGLDPEDAIRLAKAELKMQMIEALVNGEWEIEHE
jgi:hypothetical protein